MDSRRARHWLWPATAVVVLCGTAAVGSTSFLDNAESADGRVYGTDGHLYQRDAPMSAAMVGAPVPVAPLAPKWEAERLMIFDVPMSAHLTRFRFGPWPGVVDESQEWSLN